MTKKRIFILIILLALIAGAIYISLSYDLAFTIFTNPQPSIGNDFSEQFYDIINSDKENLIYEFIKENREKFIAETNKLIADSLKFKHDGDFLEAENSINSAQKAATYLKRYFNDEYYINLVKFNSRLSPKEIALKLNAHKLYRIGLKEYSQENFPQAYKKFKEAEDIYKSINDRDNEANIYHAYGNIYFYLGYYDKALKEYEKAIRLANETKNVRLNIALIMNSGLIHSKIGNYSKALNNFRKAMEGLKYDNSDLLERLILNYMANVYYKLGDNETSSRIYDIALQKSISAKDINMQASILNNIGINCLMQNDYGKAEKYLQQTLKIQSNMKNVHRYASTLNSLAFINLKSGNISKALKYLEKSLPLARQAENLFILADCLNMLGESYMKLKDFQRASDYLSESLQICENINNPYLTYWAYRNKGLTFKLQEKFRESEKQFLNAINLIEKVRAGIEETDLKGSYLSIIKPIYEDMILLQILNLNNHISALEFSERSRARAFLDMLAGKIDIIYSNNNFIQDEEAVKQNFGDILIDDEYGTLRALTFDPKSSPKYKNVEIISPMAVNPFPLKEIRNSLSSGSKILEYEITKDKTIIWVISKEKIQSQIITIDSDELRNLIIEFRKALALDDKFSKRYKTWDERTEETDRLSKKLYDILFKPIRKFLHKGDLLYIIPDNELYYIPFASLKSEHGKYIIEEFDLAYAPSSSILKICYSRNKNKIEPEEDKILLIGNPSIPENILADFPVLKPLKEAENEVREISKIFSRSLLLIGAEAREKKIREEIENFEIIHFATHSLVDERMPMYSSIMLNASREHPDNLTIENPDDGLLMLLEIFNLNLSRSKLITLSSCETGFGKLLNGEGIIGLSRAFIYAGSPSILASLWKVKDSPTSLLLQGFYSNIKNNNISKARALKNAQLQFINSNKYRHPFFWSSFIIIGDGR